MSGRIYILIPLALLVILCIVLFVNVPEQDISFSGQTDMKYYPQFFMADNFSAVFVIDDNAIPEDIAAANAIASGLGIGEPDPVRYGSLEGIGKQNAIFIGTCSAEPHNKFVNIFVDCLSLDSGKAAIRLTKMNGYYILFVVGSNPESTMTAGEALESWKEYGVPGREIIVSRKDNQIETMRIK